ncbi:MAG: 7-cyano-7-deazaguanine synthase [Thermoproteota archaeon]|nr:7-cyano-7-deazaguanine synthase [Thermoproteota archaeon]
MKRYHNIIRAKEASSVVCIVSGGLDSVCTAAHLKKEKKYNLYFLSYFYGQRARNEIHAARRFAKMLNAKDHKVVNIEFMKKLYGKTNVLTDHKKQLPGRFNYSIVVPIRNVIFISIASAWAMSMNATVVAYGAHLGDLHYPDCRPEFIRSMSFLLNLAEEDGIRQGVRQAVQVWAPALQGISKSQLLRSGHSLLGDKVFDTWSCYTGGVQINGNTIHCGVCESCINRKVAISEAGLDDRTQYAKN